jgi:hypothetical protein
VLSLDEQCKKIENFINKFDEEGISPLAFVAPSHTFDSITLNALKLQSQISIISDTIAFFPYNRNGFLFIPQQMSFVRKIFLPGIYTFCYHPNTMSDADYTRLEKFIMENSDKFIDLNSIKIFNNRPKSVFDKLFSFMYFTFRSLFR